MRETSSDRSREQRLLAAMAKRLGCQYKQSPNLKKYRLDGWFHNGQDCDSRGEMIGWAECKWYGDGKTAFCALNVPKYAELINLSEMTGLPSYFVFREQGKWGYIVLHTSSNKAATFSVIQTGGTAAAPTITIGSDVVIDSGDVGAYAAITYDTTNNKVFLAYDNSGDGKVRGAIGTVTAGTNSISFTTPADIFDYSAAGGDYFDVIYDDDKDKVMFFYRDDNNSDALTYKIITSGASSFSVADGAVISSNDNRLNGNAASFGAGKGVLVGTQDTGNSNKLSYATTRFVASTTTTLDNGNYLGIAAEAISDTATGKINVIGGLSEGHSSLTIGNHYFTNGAGTVGLVGNTTGEQYLGRAISATEIQLLENEGYLYGTAEGAVTAGKPVIVATDGEFEQVKETSTSVTYSAGSETEVQAGTGSIQYASITYDIDENKYLAVYKDEGDSYGYANVLSTSGTTLSVGSKSSNFSGSAGMNIIDSVYDEESGNHVIFYYNTSNQYGYAVVASISGTSVSYGTPVAFNSANTHYRGTAFYDSTNKKVVWVGGHFSGSYLLKAVVGTVSGTSITFGSLQDSGVSSTDYYSSAYDKNSSVGVAAYRDTDAHGNIRTLSISGTSITWNTNVEFQASNTTMSADGMTYDETNNKIVLFFKDSSDNVQGIVGTVSGTTISMGTAVDSTLNNGSMTFACVWTKQGVIALINRDDSSPYYLKYIQATVSGTSLTYAGAATLNGQAVSVDATGVSIAYNSSTYDVVPFYVENGAKDAQGVVVIP